MYIIDIPMQVINIDRSDLDIGERLGKGGFGCVYEGKWKKGGDMTVAIKVTHTAVTPQEIKVWGPFLLIQTSLH